MFSWLGKIILVLFLLSDLVYINYLLLTRPSVNSVPSVLPTPVDQCGPACQQYIDTKITLSQKDVPVTVTIPQPKSTTIARPKVRTVSYLPIPTGGLTLSNDWTGISGTNFYFDSRDYPGLKEIFFEANAHLFNGNGIAYVRLYDSSNNVGVIGSEVQTKNQSDTALISSPVRFYNGKNLIQVQIKSLTADSAVFTSGRLKIITEN